MGQNYSELRLSNNLYCSKSNLDGAMDYLRSTSNKWKNLSDDDAARKIVELIGLAGNQNLGKNELARLMNVPIDIDKDIVALISRNHPQNTYDGFFVPIEFHFYSVVFYQKCHKITGDPDNDESRL